MQCDPRGNNSHGDFGKGFRGRKNAGRGKEKDVALNKNQFKNPQKEKQNKKEKKNNSQESAS